MKNRPVSNWALVRNQIAMNREKTTFSDLKQVLKYAENEDKTIDKNEKSLIVTKEHIIISESYQMNYVENMD